MQKGPGTESGRLSALLLGPLHSWLWGSQPASSALVLTSRLVCDPGSITDSQLALAWPVFSSVK